MPAPAGTGSLLWPGAKAASDAAAVRYGPLSRAANMKRLNKLRSCRNRRETDLDREAAASDAACAAAAQVRAGSGRSGRIRTDTAEMTRPMPNESFGWTRMDRRTPRSTG